MEFMRLCVADLDRQLGSMGTTAPSAPTPVKNIRLREFQEKVYERGQVDPLGQGAVEVLGPRERKTTTVTVQVPGVGKMQVSKFSHEQREEEGQGSRPDRSDARAVAVLSKKQVLVHDKLCRHCGDNVLRSDVITTVERDASGKLVKKRRVEAAGHCECTRCPLALHCKCLALPQYQGLAQGSCPMHRCTLCRRAPSAAGGLLLRCLKCTVALCWECVEQFDLLSTFRPEEGCVEWEGRGYQPPSAYEYITCPNCM
jgi:hypothetical protein